eukprot:COSAG05_NODE_17956_length_316_cov_0.949309_1_plen_89_part_01
MSYSQGVQAHRTCAAQSSRSTTSFGAGGCAYVLSCPAKAGRQPASQPGRLTEANTQIDIKAKRREGEKKRMPERRSGSGRMTDYGCVYR